MSIRNQTNIIRSLMMKLPVSFSDSDNARVAGVAALTIALALVVAAPGCARASADEVVKAAAPVVKTIKPERRTLSRDVTVAGSLLSWSRASLRPRVKGYVEKLEVDIGSFVKKGDVLAFVAVPELDAEMSVAQALAHVETAKAKGAGNVGRVSQKRFARLNKLFRGDPHTVAADRVDAAASHAARTRSVKDTAEAMQRARVAQLRRAEVLRDYQSVRAPFDGVVTTRNVDVGDLVGPGDAAAMFVVATQGKLRARFALPEAAAMRVTVGQNMVSITVPSAPGSGVATTKVVRSSSEVDVDTRTVTFEADVDKAPDHWLPGLYARVVVSLFRKPNAMTLPAKVLVPAKNGSSAWICSGGKATKVAVKIGLDDGETIEVLDGIKDGDSVVVEGKESLRDGGACAAEGADK